MRITEEKTPSWLDRPLLTNLTLNWETLLFTLILLVGIFTRFYDLGARVMSHDENSHVYYSWQLSEGRGYAHTPLTHGPLLFHLTAFSFFLFGDNDFTARIPFALFSIATIAFIWFYRRYLGRAGTIVAALLMTISPFMLFYGRYVRNEALVGLFGVMTIWAILRYMETGEVKYTYWLTAATVLHFTAKETAFIYTAQALLFLGLLFIYQTSQRKWLNSNQRTFFIIALIVAFLLLATAAGIGIANRNPIAPIPDEATATEVIETATTSLAKTGTYILLGLGGVSILVALYAAIAGLGWETIRKDRSFTLIILLLTMVLPQLAPFPTRMVGWNPTDYSAAGIAQTAIFVIPLALISIAIGLIWNYRLWLVNAAIFYIPFTVLYTTVFTNGVGFFTGLVGSLGYWLEQQGVERGSQPSYYYALVQIPVYEFLPALGCWLAAYFGIRSWKRLTSPEDQTREEADPVDFEVYQPRGQALFLLLTGFWAITSLVAYTYAGEKMPWLTVHIALPMILISGWALGKLIENIDWQTVRTQRGILLVTLLIVGIISLGTAMGSFSGPERPFQGQDLAQLNLTSRFLISLVTAIASTAGLIYLLRSWEIEQLIPLGTLTVFAILGLLTARTAFRAAYINYDYPTEYLVYAHSADGVKKALAQIEELSQRTTDGLGIVVAYDDETTYPYWWYLRNYPNQKYYGANPTRELREAPVILIGDNNFAKIEPVVGQAYYRFDYNRVWWPNQDYYNLTWERVSKVFTDADLRAALWQIWFNRDYTKYAEWTGRDFSLAHWSPSDRMRLYVRKDIAAQVWNLGASPTFTEELLADPYENKGITLSADQVIGVKGSESGQFLQPRNVAVAPDGSLYVADSGNHRIQHLTTDGQVLQIWGRFADSAVTPGGAPLGTFYEPWGIAVDGEGFVYVADTWNHRIQKFSAQGDFILQWGYFGQGETSTAFWGPRDIAIDKEGRVYVTDTGNKRIVIFDSEGNFISEFGSPGLLAGQFDEPVGIALDTEGNIYIADTWNQRIQVFSPGDDGLGFMPIREWNIVGWYGQSLDNKPYLAVDAQGHVYVSDPEGYRVLEFDNQGEFIHYWGDYGDDLAGFNLPNGISIDAQGGLWVADSGNHRILHFTLPRVSDESSQP
jgi:predicted membrane-bound mannosyltransferase/DNA-binding beta-propeller fold protein YncE